MYYVLEAIDKPMRAIFFASPRKVLFITSLIMFLSSLIMSVFSVYMCQMFYDPIANNAAWLNFLGLAVVGAFLGCVCLLGMRGAHIVTLDYLLYYFWLMVVLIAPLALGCVVCFDFIIYMQLWFSHSWDTDAFENIRRIACEEGTANTKCMAPVDGGSGYNSTELWCMAEFNGATDCEAIRDAAQSQAQLWGRLLMLVEAIVSVSNIGLIIFSLYLCHKILTSPVLTQSMNDVMNFLLLLPTAACLVLAIYNWWMREYNIPFYFLAEVYLGFTVLQFLMLPMGIFAGRMKSQTLMAIYIFVATLTCCGLGATGGVSIMVAGLLPKNYGMTTATKDSVACHRNYPGCCCCDFSVDGNLVTGRCPEWSTADTVIELSIDFKISGIISFLCMSYHVGALAVSSLVHQNLQSYKSDYI